MKNKHNLKPVTFHTYHAKLCFQELFERFVKLRKRQRRLQIWQPVLFCLLVEHLEGHRVVGLVVALLDVLLAARVAHRLVRYVRQVRERDREALALPEWVLRETKYPHDLNVEHDVDEHYISSKRSKAFQVSVTALQL